MAILRNADRPKFCIGQWVKSIAVGKAPAFNGEIVQREGTFYILRDSENRRFYRTYSELEPIQ